MTNVQDLSIAGQNVSRETWERLEAFDALLRRWTLVVNLVSRASLPVLWERHIEDSAQLFAACPENACSWLDLGSGGGLPGLVVAILAHELRPGLQVTLVESDARKATFLRQAVQALKLDVGVHTERIESLAPQGADVISARALAPLRTLLGYAHRHLCASGVALFPKGARHAEEIAEARKSWEFSLDLLPSQSDPEAAILIIKDLYSARR